MTLEVGVRLTTFGIDSNNTLTHAPVFVDWVTLKSLFSQTEPEIGQPTYLTLER